MLEIDRLALQLPAGFARRAPRIARLTAQALAAHGFTQPLALGAVRVPPLRVQASRSDRAIARQIADGIAGRVNAAANRNGSKT